MADIPWEVMSFEQIIETVGFDYIKHFKDDKSIRDCLDMWLKYFLGRH